ncbi:rCG60551 [Rattus norvegicus]|uniref:RCG60551 n=1 Tax=Rattus norvegicus TaxID=10116 RepID=A6JKP5_RAT|nr:rCG60551 [Rattus norvegicus]
MPILTENFPGDIKYFPHLISEAREETQMESSAYYKLETAVFHQGSPCKKCIGPLMTL